MVEVKEAKVETIIGLYVTRVRGLRFVEVGKGVWPVQFTMPCGHHVVWHYWQDVPDKSTRCPCGDPAHWLVRYVDG